MHGTAIHVYSLLAAEKSRVPFYIAGGTLAAWAVILSVGFGLRRANFPGNLVGQRTVIAISAALVAAAISMAVVTSGSPAKKAEVSASSLPAAGGTPPPGPAPAGAPAPVASTPATTQPSTGATRRRGRTRKAKPPTTPPAASTPSATGRRGRSRKAKPPTTPAPAAPAAAPSAIALAADTSGLLAYNTKQLSANAGSVTITFTNASALEHNVTIAEGSRVLAATPTFTHGSKAITLTLKPGTYTFYCSVPGHRQAGMEGALSVT